MHEIDREILDEAGRELFIHQNPAPSRNGRLKPAAFALTAAGVLLLATALILNGESWLKTVHAKWIAPSNSAAGPVASTAAMPAVAANHGESIAYTAAPANSVSDKEEIVAESNGATRVGLRNEADAIRQLALLWNLSPADENPCGAARAQNILCHRSSGGLGELRKLNRPAVLKLYDQANRPYYAMLIGLSDNYAHLVAGDVRQDLGLVFLARHFRGEFITLWRAPAGFEYTLETGDVSPAVDWYATELAKLTGGIAPPPAQPFSQKTLKQVRHFQQAHGLFVDGVIGPVTAMHINRAAGVEEPRLDSLASMPAKRAAE